MKCLILTICSLSNCKEGWDPIMNLPTTKLTSMIFPLSPTPANCPALMAYDVTTEGSMKKILFRSSSPILNASTFPLEVLLNCSDSNIEIQVY